MYVQLLLKQIIMNEPNCHRAGVKTFY